MSSIPPKTTAEFPLTAVWLSQVPSRAPAERSIRATRSLAYFEKWDAFTRGAAWALGASAELAPFVGATLGAGMDLLFDRDLVDSEPSSASQVDRRPPNLRQLGDRLRRRTVPSPELRVFLRSDHGENVTFSLEHSVSAILAAITLAGHASDRDGRWLGLWQQWVEKTISAQIATGGLDTSRIPDGSADLGATLAPYLELAGATDMAAMTLAGLVGFSSQRAELIDPLDAFLPAVSHLVRLAADMAFDASEPVNCSIYLHAAEQAISLRQARSALAADPAAVKGVEGRLIALTLEALTELLRTADAYPAAIRALARVVERAVLSEIRAVESGHGVPCSRVESAA